MAIDLFSDKLFNGLLTYQASLLRKCTKLYKETSLIVNSLLVDKIKEKANDPDIKELDEIFSRKL